MTKEEQERTFDAACALAQVCKSFDKRLTSLIAALAGDTNGYVFCWDHYGLGVKLTNGIPATVAVEHATIVKYTDKRKFWNGSREQAMLMPRRQALRAALRTVGDSYEIAKKLFAKEEQ